MQYSIHKSCSPTSGLTKQLSQQTSKDENTTEVARVCGYFLAKIATLKPHPFFSGKAHTGPVRWSPESRFERSRPFTEFAPTPVVWPGHVIANSESDRKEDVCHHVELHTVC